jgi:hypothetical protein
MALLDAHRAVFGQQRIHLRAVALAFAELFAFHPRGCEYVSRHMITQLLTSASITHVKAHIYSLANISA